MEEEKDYKSTLYFFLCAVAFVLLSLSVILVFFPLDTLSDSYANHVVYAAAGMVLVALAVLLYFTLRRAVRDVAESIARDIGVDLDEVIADFGKMIRDDLAALFGRKRRPSDHHIED